MVNIMKHYVILTTEAEKDYELIDSGEGEKLERYGHVVVARPDPQALWSKRCPEAEWKRAGALFKGGSRGAAWNTRGDVPVRWPIEFGGLKFWIKLSTFKHTGLFPEQLGNWNWVKDHVRKAERPISVLNLFGYTGGASLAAAASGAEVCHVDGSKVAIHWARDNAELSGLKDKPIRWILDDAPKFVQREIKRGRTYDGVVLDPPAFGHGPKGELWKIEDHLLPLMENCRNLLSKQPLFVLISGYASGYSAIAYKNNLDELFKDQGGTVEVGELTIAESSMRRLLPAGIFGRWSSV
jgi:23S rRNA (cytosine1962-C5)-methyltransferase